MRLPITLLLLLLAACAPSTTHQPADPPDEAAVSGDDGPRSAREGDAPEISRSLGQEGGVLVFWTRIIPSSDDAQIHELAADLQTRLAELAKRTGATVDVRPEPERVCPLDGCKAKTLGALLVHRDGGCTALALVGGPGSRSTRILPWAGIVKLEAEAVAFRDPPENQVTVRDAVPCHDLVNKLAEGEDDVTAALGGS
jgi:hypothetical protein